MPDIAAAIVWGSSFSLNDDNDECDDEEKKRDSEVNPRIGVAGSNITFVCEAGPLPSVDLQCPGM
jgi:hypothetical protein